MYSLLVESCQLEVIVGPCTKSTYRICLCLAPTPLGQSARALIDGEVGVVLTPIHDTWGSAHCVRYPLSDVSGQCYESLLRTLAEPTPKYKSTRAAIAKHGTLCEKLNSGKDYG
jgi:hypothetical protein